MSVKQKITKLLTISDPKELKDSRPKGSYLMLYDSYSEDLKKYFEKVRDYIAFIVVQLGDITLEDKMREKTYCFGFDLVYKGCGFSLVWENPYHYFGKFAEILGMGDIIRRLDLEDMENLKEFFDSIIDEYEQRDEY